MEQYNNTITYGTRDITLTTGDIVGLIAFGYEGPISSAIWYLFGKSKKISIRQIENSMPWLIDQFKCLGKLAIIDGKITGDEVITFKNTLRDFYKFEDDIIDYAILHFFNAADDLMEIQD